MPCTDPVLEQSVVDGVAPYLGLTIAEIAARLGVKPSRAKSYGAIVVRALLASLQADKSQLQYTRRGISPKTVRKPRDGRPYESMSFPAFDPRELVKEKWETSTFRKDLRCLLIVVLYSPTRDTPISANKLGRALFWSPSVEESERIGQEWEMLRSGIERGQTLRLPGEADTRAIHVRTHGRDALDMTPTPGVGGAPRRSFWLNKDYVARIIRQHVRGER